MHLLLLLALAVAARAEAPTMSLLAVQARTERPPEAVEPSAGLAGLANADVLTFPSRGNGGQKVTVLARTGAARDACYVWFPGDLDRPPAGAKTLAQLVQEVWDRHPGLVFVIPDGAGPAQGFASRWSKVVSARRMEEEALERLGVTSALSWRGVGAHSGGGYAIARLLARGELREDRVILLDTPMQSILRLFKTFRRPGMARIDCVLAAQPGWTVPTPADAQALGIALEVRGPGPDALPDAERHYQVRDEFFGSFLYR